MKTVLLISTLDTKGEESRYLREEILKRGCKCLVMDVGVLSKPLFAADINRDQVIKRGGGVRQELETAATQGAGRGQAVDIVIRGGSAIAKELFQDGKVDGVISMGGSTGTSIGTSIMRALPFGVPKVQVSTLPGTSRDMTRFFGTKDIMMLNSVVDLVGLNSITRVILEEAAGAITGMLSFATLPSNPVRCVAITCLGVTTPMVMKVREGLVERGREVVVLHKKTHALNDLVAQGLVDAVLDLTPNELIDLMFFPGGSSGAQRLAGVRETGIPQIIAPGGLDMIITALPVKDLPEQYQSRKQRIHTAWNTLVRTSKPELRLVGETMGTHITQSKGPVGVVIPLGGFSAMDCEGSDFRDTEADREFVEALRKNVDRDIEIREVHANIN